MLKMSLACVVVVSLAVAQYANRPSPAWDEKLQAAVEAELRDAQGDRADGARIRDKIRLVYFAAAWCPHCRDFTSELIGFYEARHGGDAFEVILVSGDDSEAEMDAHMADDRMPWLAVDWGSDAGKALAACFYGSGLPCLVMIDAEGNVIADRNRNRSEMLRELEKLL